MVEHHAIQTMQDLRIERNQMQYTNAMTNPTNIVLRIFGAVALIWAMPLTQQAQDTGSILTVGTESVSAADFQHVFLKNNRDSLITTASLDEYMELFTKFKLKVAEAEALGYDTIPKLVKELNGYKTQLALHVLSSSFSSSSLLFSSKRCLYEMDERAQSTLRAQDAPVARPVLRYRFSQRRKNHYPPP